MQQQAYRPPDNMKEQNILLHWMVIKPCQSCCSFGSTECLFLMTTIQLQPCRACRIPANEQPNMQRAGLRGFCLLNAAGAGECAGLLQRRGID